ncbi:MULTISPECIES: excinuclease ABC subunit UvrC [Pseudomonas]|jgi:excinuclease ABC subunit C|uniref:UvrABC system protein C n=1 Tax=Pseudomonas fluorescens TaxID=294 RepID=A0A166QV57_PSEFL|nr:MULTISPECIES: excinuclease ABC subunit UvrC [Pseudomonas]KZN20894.1 excinuclease ABC subunit C [Pseudomonas fluorescens]MBD9563039.1 excinuclease ABC subunit UvrC [Pseudomonas sp. PDM09]
MTEIFDPSAFLSTVSGRPGVYRMFDSDARLLYVGKAKNLKKRLASYFRKAGLAPKTAALVGRIAQVETTITANETEALLLEQTLIKEWRPPYNILLRDDKSYPYVFLSDGQFPRLSIHRGAKKAKGKYFGPYPSAGAIRESLSLLQKAFFVRQCEDSFYKNRARPCLQYQIKRCKAPCVGLVEPEVYAEDVRHSVMFLEGRSNALADELSAAMEEAAVNLEFERAAELRDQISLLRRVQDQQSMEGGTGDVDVIAAFVNPGGACVHLISVRGGRVLGSKNFFPQVGIEEDVSEVMAAFLGQYFISSPERDLPSELIVNVVHEDFPTLIAAIEELRGRELTISHRVRGTRARWQQLAVTNAEQALGARLANRQHVAARFDALAEVLNLDEPPQRLECYDISHSSGEATVASCVVFGPEGPIKSDYRRYNIEGVTPGDDYAAMHQALTRRFSKLKDGEGKLPDILLVDGGKGQLSMARDVLNELAVPDLILLGVAKGATRKAGFETLYLNDAAHEFTLRGDSPALHLIQQIRDEAHRFAITGHRARRGKTRRTSTLEGVAGVGPTRRRDLLKHFGGLQELSRASIEEIAKAPGISKKLAELIYANLHSE